MFRALDRSIRLKLLMVVTITTFAALLLTAAVLVTYEIRSYETSAINDLLTQAEIVGRSSTAALQFDDPVTAKQNLDLLRVRPRIVGAAIYRADGHRFADYHRDVRGDTILPVQPTFAGSRLAGDRLELFQPITDADGRIGTVYLRSTLGLRERLRTYLLIVGLALAMSLALALAMSSWLQRAVTEPILAVSRVAHEVKSRRDLSLRAPKLTSDEIGELVDTFNDMITEVGQRTGALEQANRTLEREMAVRQEAEQALRAADQRKDEFLATLAHELRNPLAPLRNGLEILRGPARPDDARSTMQIMDRQLRQLVRLVDDLLDVSRITTGKLTLRKEDVELSSLVQNALDAAQPLIDARKLRLTVNLPDAPVILCADTTRIAQVLLNLLHNATKFTEPGGAIVLAAEADDGTVTVHVTDTGIGIPHEQLPQVFDMFAQLDRSLERTTSGLGVGLSLSRRLVELHGGTLEAASEGTGRGSTFTMRLPRERLDASAARAVDVGAADAPVHHRVLLVDDNADFVESFALLLERMGHQVRIAHDGEEALAAAREFAPDVAFLDIGLPKINGYDLAMRMRARSTGALTLIAVTGWGQESDKQRAREAGFDHHMTKPVDLEQVGRILASIGEPAARPQVVSGGEMS